MLLGSVLYNAAVVSLTPIAAISLSYRRWRGQQTKQVLDQLWGYATIPTPAAPVVWFAVTTIGESAIVLPLLQRLLQVHPHIHILVTTTDMGAFALLQHAIQSNQIHLQVSPIGTPGAVRRFLLHWKPIAAAFVMLSEPKLSPIVLGECKRRNIPTALLNVHVPVRDFSAWDQSTLGRPWLASLLTMPDLIVPQSDSDSARLLLLGAPLQSMPLVSAELTYAAAMTVNLVGWKLQRPHAAAVDAVHSSIGNRPVWFASNTHPGEEIFLTTIHLFMTSHETQPIPNLLTIIAPHNTQRCGELQLQLEAKGVRVGRWSLLHAGPHVKVEGIDVLLIDDSKAVALLYAAVNIVLVGGTIFPSRRHHSLADVAVCGCTIVTGPHLAQYEGMKEELNEAALEEAAELQEELHCQDTVYVDAQGQEWAWNLPHPHHTTQPHHTPHTLQHNPTSTSPTPAALGDRAPLGEDSPFASSRPSVDSITATENSEHPSPPGSTLITRRHPSGGSISSSISSAGYAPPSVPGASFSSSNSGRERGDASGGGMRSGGSGSGRRASGRTQQGPVLSTVSEHPAMGSGSREASLEHQLDHPSSPPPLPPPQSSTVPTHPTPPPPPFDWDPSGAPPPSFSAPPSISHRRSSVSSTISLRVRSAGRPYSDGVVTYDGLVARRTSESRSSAAAHGLRSTTLKEGPVLEGGLVTQEPIWATPSRHCGHVLLLAHVLGTQPAVLTCKDTQEIRHEVHRLLCNPVEARSRGYAAATAASRLTRGMVATVLGLFGTKILEPQLRQQ